MLLFLLLWSLQCYAGVSQGFSWVHEFSCPPGQLYDTSGLTCTQCGQNQVASESCECAAGYIKVFQSSAYDGTSFGTCQACSTGASSADRLRCVECDSSTGPQQRSATVQNGECVCSDNADRLGVISERDTSGSLIQDANGTFIQQCLVCSAPQGIGATTCGYCEYPKVMNSDAECVCPTTLPPNVRCSNTDALQRIAASLRVDIGSQPYAVSTASLGNSDPIVISISAALKEYLAAAVEGCHDFGHTESCNTLANLCTIQQYDNEALACTLFKAISQLRSRELYRPAEVTSSVAWAKTLPWLYYPAGLNTLALDSNDVETEMRFRGGSLESGSVSQLTFLLAAYTLSGEFLGLRPIGSVLQLCGARTSQADLWTHVGTYYQNECTVDPSQLVWSTQNSTLLYDLYFVDGVVDSTSDSEEGFDEILRRQLGGTPVLFPVPLILHSSDDPMIDGSGNDNADGDMQLARRFFTVDTSLGTPAGDSYPTWVQFLASATLVVEMSSESRSHIKPPRLHLRYDTRRLTVGVSAAAAEGEGGGSAVTTRFSVRYLNSAAVRGQFEDAWNICMGVFLSVGLLCGLIQSMKWKERKKGAGSDDEYSFLLCVVSNATHSAGVALTAVALVLSLHAFVLFKGQRDSFLYIIPNEALADLRLTIILAASFLGWSMAYTLYCQTRLTDLALIDWERPQQVINEEGQHTEGTVSCWRSILIANAFNSLSVQRRARPALSFFILVRCRHLPCTATGGWRRAALASADSTEDVCPGTLQRNDALAFGAAAGGYLIAVGSQLGVRLLLSSLRLPQLGNLEDPRLSFMDLLYFTNISLCIFDEPTAGFYLDGKFMEPRSDDSLQTLTRNLEKQRAGSIMRKLESRMVFVGADMYDAYTLKKLDLRWGPQSAASANRDAQLTSLLKGFMEDSAQVVEPTFWQRWTRDSSVREKVDSSGRHTVHARDAHSMWSSSLFYGQELQLVCLEVTVMGAIDLSLRNTLVSAVVTWILSASLALLRKELGRRNVARCTRVDLRFLS